MNVLNGISRKGINFEGNKFQNVLDPVMTIFLVFLKLWSPKTVGEAHEPGRGTEREDPK